jgi:hypothetical protein
MNSTDLSGHTEAVFTNVRIERAITSMARRGRRRAMAGA